MKLKKLTIENVASIEYAEIDFNATPLRDEHLFLITGETGSGKSTIIDCLCLALYGSTPRLESARRREGGYEDVNRNSIIRAHEPKQLLRRGTVSANVTLTFDDNKGTPYIATWHVRRSHRKLENHIMPPERTLKTDEGVTPPVYMEKINEINKEIVKLIGLDMNEFFRTVVLAQGKFAEFLNSDENDKAALLEKMTGTEVFTQVGRKIFEVFREKENHRNHLLASLNEIELLKDDEKAEIVGEIEELNKKHGMTRQRSEGARKMAEWLDEKKANEQNLSQKLQDLARHEETTREAAFIAQQQLVNDWDTTIEARREMRDMRHAQRSIAQLKQEQPAMQEEFDQLCAALRATIKDVDDKRKKVDEIGNFIQQEAPNSAMYEAVNTIKSQMKQRLSEQKNIKAFTEALEQDHKRLPQVEAQEKSSLEAKQQQEEHVKQLQTKYDDIKVDSVNTRKDAITEAKQSLTLHKTKLDAIQQEAAHIKKQQAALDLEQQNHDRAKAVIEAKRALKEQAHDALEREKDWNALIEQAHRSLHEGETCPVCGNRITHLQPPKGENALDLLKKRLKEANDDLQQTETTLAATTQSIKRIEQEIGESNMDMERKKADCNHHWELTCDMLSRCGKTADEMANPEQTDALIMLLDKDLSGLNTTLQQAKALQDQISSERDKLTQLANAHNKAQIDLNKVHDSIKYQEAAIELSKKKFNEITTDLNGLFAMSDWQELAEKKSDFIEELEQRASHYQRQVKSVQQLESAINVTRAVIPAMQENKNNIIGLVDNGKSSDMIPRNLDVLWRQFENKNINWNNQLNNERQKAEHAQQALDKYLDEHRQMTVDRLAEIDGHEQSEIATIKKSQQTLVELIVHTRGEIASLKNQQQAITDKKPDFIEQNREELSRIIQESQVQLEELTNHIADLRAKLKQDEDNRKTAGKKQEEFETADAEYQQWQEFNTMLGDSNGATFRKIAQSYILGELLACANGYLHQFNNRYALEAKPGTLTILVRDQIQGDLTTVSTLSGGEGFMVSLALALALSSTTGKMFSVDTLFIDEGFGSLSENYLDKVMETLNRLYDMGGKRVGIISHVELLKERVTTQIQVSRDSKNNTVSRVTVV